MKILNYSFLIIAMLASTSTSFGAADHSKFSFHFEDTKIDNSSDMDQNDLIVKGEAVTDYDPTTGNISSLYFVIEPTAAGSRDRIQLLFDESQLDAATGGSPGRCYLHNEFQPEQFGSQQLQTATSNIIYGSREEAFPGCSSSTIINTEQGLTNLCKGDAKVISCENLYGTALNYNSMSVPEIISRLLILRNVSQNQNFGHSLLENGNSFRMLMPYDTGWSEERANYFDAMVGIDNTESVSDGAGGTRVIGDCKNNLDSDAGCRAALSNYLREHSRTKLNQRSRVIRNSVSTAQFNIKHLSGGTASNPIFHPKRLNPAFPNDLARVFMNLVYDGMAFFSLESIISQLYECDLIQCPPLDVLPPTVTDDANVDLGFQYWNGIYNIDQQFATPELPDGCSSFDETFYVGPDGSDDNNDGLTVNSKFKTITKAMETLSNTLCTLIRVYPGEYFEIMDFNYSNKNRTTIFGEDRATTIVNSKSPVQGFIRLTPEECPEGKECDIYKKDFDNHYPANTHISYKDQILVPIQTIAQYSFREKIVASDLVSNTLPADGDSDGYPDIKIADDLRSTDALSVTGRENFKDHVLHTMMNNANGLKYANSAVLNKGDLSFSGLRAIYYVHQEQTANEDSVNGVGKSTIYIRALDGEPNPGDHISMQLGYTAYIRDAENIVVQNLTLLNGRYNVLIYRNSNNIKVLGNIIKGGYRNVYAFGNSNGRPTNLLVKGNEITNNYAAVFDPQQPGHYRNFFLIKEIHTDAHGIYLLNYGADIELANNFIYKVGNGIQNWNDLVSYTDENLVVRNNLLINVLDDGLEIGGYCKGCRWHSNHVRNAAQSIRLKLNDSRSVGPVYIYNNVTYNNAKYSHEGYGGNEFLNAGTELFFHTGTNIPIYVYNNLFHGSRCYNPPTGGHLAEAGKNFYMINNIFDCRYSFGKIREGALPSGRGNTTEKNDQILQSHNWYGGTYDSRPFWINGKLHLDHFDMMTFDGTGNHETSASGERPVSYFGEDMNSRAHTNFLNRKDFCQNQTSTLSGQGLEVSNPANLSWNYVDITTYSGVDYHHVISRSITDENGNATSLPGVLGDHIGPFTNGQAGCNNLGWIAQ